MKYAYLWIILLVFLDQGTKYFFPGIKNTGGVFGILTEWTLVFIILGIIVLLFLIFFMKHVHGYGRFAFILLISGILGNLIDRIFLGYVRDFVDLKFWPVFNLADSYTTIGIAILLFYFWKKK